MSISATQATIAIKPITVPITKAIRRLDMQHIESCAETTTTGLAAVCTDTQAKDAVTELGNQVKPHNQDKANRNRGKASQQKGKKQRVTQPILRFEVDSR